MMYEILIGDIVQFFGVTSVFIVAFSLASFAMTTPVRDRCFSTFATRFAQFFYGLINGFDQDQVTHLHGVSAESDVAVDLDRDSKVLAEARHTVFVVLLMMVYSLLGTTLLLNILIAMMNSTFEKISKVAEKRWNMERACIIRAVELELREKRSGHSRNLIRQCLDWFIRGAAPGNLLFYVEMDGERYLQIQEEGDWALSER